MRKITALLTMFVMVFQINSFATNAAYISENSNAKIMERTSTIFNIYIEELEAQANKLLNLSGENAIDVQIAKITTIHDFSGNKYTLIECNPSGYMIYHNESGIFVEASVVAKSPYFGCVEEKFYGGPNEYYVKSVVDGEIIYNDLKSNETISESDIAVYSEKCTLFNDTFVANKNTVILNYIEKNQALNIASSRTSSLDKWKVVDNAEFFSTMSSPGYTTIDGAGICGYIAAGMLLTYEQVTNGGNIVDSSYYNIDDSGVCSIDSSLPRDLYTLGTTLDYGTDTTSVAIHYTVKKYFENRGISAFHTSLYAPLANNDAIKDAITLNRPVIWFGHIISNSTQGNSGINHAIVVYGYDSRLINGYSYIAHFGWNDASLVTFTGVLGSMYTFTIN